MQALILGLVLSGLKKLLAFALAHWEGVLAATFHFVVFTGAPLVVKLIGGLASLLFASLYGGKHGIKL